MLLLLLPPPVLLLLTKRRGDAGLLRMRVCGFWGLVAQCGAAQRSARNTQAGAPAGPEIELMQRSQVMLFMGWHGRLKAGWNEPQKRAQSRIRMVGSNLGGSVDARYAIVRDRGGEGGL